MPRHTAKRSYLSADVVAQLKTLFGKAPTVHGRLNLGNVVPLTDVQKMLAGYPVPEKAERVLLARWAEWREVFLADPSHTAIDRERISRTAGDFYHPDARDALTEHLVEGVAQRFTLLPDAAKFQ